MGSKTKTLLDLVSLGTTMYVLSKDEELMEQFSRYTSKGKEKLKDILYGTDEEIMNDEVFMNRLKARMKEGEMELEKRIGEMVTKAYRRLHIAHTDEMQHMQQELDRLRKEVAEIRKSYIK